MEKRSYWWGWTRRGVVVLMGTSYRHEPGRGGDLAGSGLLCFTGFRERRQGSNGGSAHLAEEGMVVGGRPGGGVRWLKMAAVLGQETAVGFRPEEGEEGVVELGRTIRWAGVLSVWAGRQAKAEGGGRWPKRRGGEMGRERVAWAGWAELGNE
jgi:hypothetical protein